MTIKNSGQVSTRDVSQQLHGRDVFTANVSTSDGKVQRLVRKTSGITFPGDFRGKGWGQQMTAVSNGYNEGDSSNMKPYMMDRRVDGGKMPGTDKHKLDTSKGGLAGVYMQNNINSGITTPVELAWNGYYICHHPVGGTQSGHSYTGGTVSASCDFETNYIYSPGYPRTSLNLFGFSAGYLSGSRTTLASTGRNNETKGKLTVSGGYNASRVYICVNMALWHSEAGRSETWMWNGYAS